MDGVDLAELLSKKAKRDRAKAGRAAGGDATAEQKVKRLNTTSVFKRLDRKNQSVAKAARAVKVSERKIRQGQEVKRASRRRTRWQRLVMHLLEQSGSACPLGTRILRLPPILA